MDEKTEHLRDLFVDVTAGDTVTEHQEESPGTLADDQSKEDRLRALLEAMDDHYGLGDDVTHETMLTIARGFYDETPDDELAETVDRSSETVRRVRFALHLVRDGELDGPVPDEQVDQELSTERSVSALATEYDAAEQAVRRQLAATRAASRMRQASHRFRDQWDELLGDADVADHMPDDVTEDGLREATEDIEVDTAF